MRAQKLRDLIHDDELLLLPSVHDALSGRIAQSVGFDAIYLGGNHTGATTTATEPMITSAEMCERGREITHNVNLPLVADGDAGFGDPAHTHRSVKMFAHNDIAGIHIEDQVYPKRLHYHAGRHHIVDEEEMILKLETATQAKKELEEIGKDIVVMGRTDAARGQRREEGNETIEDAIERANNYLDAGAELAFVFPDDIEEAEQVASNVEGPVSFLLAETREMSYEVSVDDISNMGYDAVVYPLSGMISTTKALQDLYTSIYETGEMVYGHEEGEEIHNEILELIDLPKYYDIEELSGKK